MLGRPLPAARAIARYADAARHVRRRQILHRARRPLPYQLLALRLDRASPPPGWRPLAAGLAVEDAPMFGPIPPPHVDRVFRAGSTSRLAGADGFWFDSSDGLLFLFHLHGFSDLARYSAGSPSSEGDAFWSGVVADWLVRCGTPSAPGWHPYPMSGRVTAWCAGLSSKAGWTAELRERMLTSIWLQVRLLARSIEHDIGGNHVLRNAVALVVAGACLEHDETRDRGLTLLERELATQVLADGGHEERSTSYQRQIIGDLRDVTVVLERSGQGIPAWLDQACGRMTTWLQNLAGPTGELPPLNDGWDGPPVDALNERATMVDLSDSGYVVFSEGGTQAVLDVGELAPPYLPAHAHADALSFVLWADGKPVVVDPGSYAYAGTARDLFRSTRAHNTVEIDGRDQCEFWGAFRASFMPTVQRSPSERYDATLVLRAEHDGYERLDDPVIHERTFIWLGSEGLIVLDRLVANAPHSVVTRLHFTEALPGPLGTELPGGLRLLSLGPEPGEPCQRSGARAPYLGSKVPIAVVERSGEVQPGVRFGWALTRSDLDVRLEPYSVELAAPGRAARSVPLA